MTAPQRRTAALGFVCLLAGFIGGRFIGKRHGIQAERERMVAVVLGKDVVFENICIFNEDGGLRVTAGDRCPRFGR